MKTLTTLFALLLTTLLLASTAEGRQYRSKASGNWGTVAVWDSSGDGGATFTASLATTPGSGDTVLIQDGFTVTLEAAKSAGRVTVKTASTLNDSTFALTVSGTFTLESGATFKQGGSVTAAPGATRSFDNNSTFIYNGSQTSITSNFSFGNLIWSSSGNATPGGNLTINGDLTLLNSAQLRGSTGATTPSRTHTVLGNVIVDGATSILVGSNASVASNAGTWNISGNVTLQNSGTLRGVNDATDGVFNIGGNLNSSGGKIVTGAGSGDFKVVFTGGASTVTFTPSSEDTIKSLLISPGKSVTLSSNNIRVNTVATDSGTLNCGTNLVTGPGNFTLVSGATLGIGSPDGITSSGATGNIQVSGTRSFSKNGKYTYNGSAAQVTGSGLPDTVNTLKIDNSSGVTLTAGLNVSVGDTLFLVNGSLVTTDSYTLSANGAVVRTNGQVVGNLLKLVSGPGSPSVTYELGVNPFTPVKVDFFGLAAGSGPLIVKATPGEHSDIANSGIDSTKDVNAFWTLSPIGLPAFDSAHVTLFYPGSLKDGGADASKFIVAKKPEVSIGNGSNWTLLPVRARTDTSTQANVTGTEGFSDFVVGEPPPVNTITIKKFRATSSTDTSSTVARTWGLKLRTGSVTGDAIKQVNSTQLDTSGLADGTYYACEADSSGSGWTTVGAKADGESLVTDTCVAVAVENGQSRTVKFWNFHQNRITIKKFRATSETDTTSTIAKTWVLKLKTGSKTGDVIKEVNSTQLDTSGLADGTYYACEVDSSDAGWSVIGMRISYTLGGSGLVFPDTCIAVSVEDGESETVSFYNFKPVNIITIKKYRSTSDTDTSSTIAKVWGLKLRTGSNTGTIIKEVNDTQLDTVGLGDGTYYACEADSGGWIHVGNKLDNTAARLLSNNCDTVTVASGQSRTVKFWNFHNNVISVEKYRATSATDSSTSSPKTWWLEIRIGSPNGSLFGAGNGVTAISTFGFPVPDGTYYACELDSAGWVHTRSQLDDLPTKSFVDGDRCIQVTVSDGQSRRVRFWNWNTNTITIKKFRATSTTDTSSTIAKTWGLRLKAGSSEGTVIKEVNATQLDTVGLADGTYYACEASDSSGWSLIGVRITYINGGSGVPQVFDSCRQVTVTGGQSRTVSFYNFKPVNIITIKKFRATSATDTGSTTARTWDLRLKTGSFSGTIIKNVNASQLDTVDLADGTYYACEADSFGGGVANPRLIGYRLDAGPAVLSATDTCRQVVVTGGQSKTVTFYNFHPNRIVVSKNVSSSATDTSSVTGKDWYMKLKRASATGDLIFAATGQIEVNGLADGTYFACEADSAGWTRVGYRVTGEAAQLSTDSCAQVAVSGGGQLKFVKFWNFKLVPTFCTYTQGDWGGGGFTYNGPGPLKGKTRDEILTELLPLTLGSFGTRSLTIGDSAKQCIVDRLPAGGGASALPNTLGDDTLDAGTCNTSPTPLPLTHAGGFRNKLLGETIALALNIGLTNSAGFDLGGFTLPSLLCTSNGTFKFSGGSAWAAGKTVGQILGIADSGLAGLPTPKALSGIASVIGNINAAFRNCSVVLVCGAGAGDVATGGEESLEPEASFIPTAFALHQSYPNPFNPSTIIRFDIAEPSIVTLKVYNVLGQEVAVLVNGEFREAGRYDVRMDGSKLSSGVYFYRLTAGPSTSSGQAFTEMRKMLLLK